MEKNLQLPGNPRYQPKQLKSIFGYDNLYQPYIEVEMANLKALRDIGVMPMSDWNKITTAMQEALSEITTSETDEFEKAVTKHDIRALVQLVQRKLGLSAGKWVHILLTSYDVIETARTLQFVRAFNECLEPSLKSLFAELVNKIGSYADTPQIGRTHGQHALPITVGFWLATLLHRIFSNYLEMKRYANALTGKISGAVGAYNAQVGLGMSKKSADFEKRVLSHLHLEPSKISTQILPPESLSYFLFSCTMASASLGQLGRDCRQLMRTEIGEVLEQFSSGQVGSSTMAHKRNPINFENTEGMWLKTKNEFGKVLDTLISEHQRDLVGSCVARDFPIIIVNLQQQLNTLLRKDKEGKTFISRIIINEEACQRNLKQSAGLVIAEPLYIAMQMAGYRKDAHKLVNEVLMPLAKEQKISLFEALDQLTYEDENVNEAFQKIPEDVKSLLENPEKYTGHAREKALEIARDVSHIFLYDM